MTFKPLAFRDNTLGQLRLVGQVLLGEPASLPKGGQGYRVEHVFAGHVGHLLDCE